jgi:hypothetical protein
VGFNILHPNVLIEKAIVIFLDVEDAFANFFVVTEEGEDW